MLSSRLALSTVAWRKPAHLLPPAQSCNVSVGSPSIYKPWFLLVLLCYGLEMLLPLDSQKHFLF